MQQLEPKLEIASRLLSGIIAQDRNRTHSDRSDDIRHSIEVAAELIRQTDEQSPPDLDLTLRPPVPIKTREALIEREQISLDELRSDRKRQTPARASDWVKGPTLH
jgi:hypothetical protein